MTVAAIRPRDPLAWLLLDLRVVVRQSLRYALARNRVLIAQVLVSIVLVFASLALVSDPDVNRPRRLTYLALDAMGPAR